MSNENKQNDERAECAHDYVRTDGVCTECGGSATITCSSKHCPQAAQPDERAAFEARVLVLARHFARDYAGASNANQIRAEIDFSKALREMLARATQQATTQGNAKCDTSVDTAAAQAGSANMSNARGAMELEAATQQATTGDERAADQQVAYEEGYRHGLEQKPEYNSCMGDAASLYFSTFKSAHPLPAQFRWEDAYEAMMNSCGKRVIPSPAAGTTGDERAAPTPQQISDYLNSLDAIQREVAQREARATTPSTVAGSAGQAPDENLIQIDRRDFFDFVRGAIRSALSDGSCEGADDGEPKAAADCWSEAHSRTEALFDKLAITAPSLATDAGAVLTDEQRTAIKWAADRAHVESLGKSVDHHDSKRWRVLKRLSCSPVCEDSCSAEASGYACPTEQSMNVADAPKVEPAPQRAVVFRIDVQADTKDELSDVLFNLSNRVQGDDLSSHSVSGGYGSGYEHWLTVNDGPTHAEYVAQLDEYLKRKEAERAEGNRAPIDVHQQESQNKGGRD